MSCRLAPAFYMDCALRSAWGCAAARMQSSAVGNYHDDDDLIGFRRIGHAYRDCIEMVEGPVIVLMAQRHVEAGAAGSNFDVGRYHRFAPADCRPHRLAKQGVNAGAAMLEFAVEAYDGALAIRYRAL